MYKDDLAAALARQEALEKEIRELKSINEKQDRKHKLNKIFKNTAETTGLLVFTGCVLFLFYIVINHSFDHRLKNRICNTICLSSKEYIGRKSYIDYTHVAKEKYIECKCALVKDYELKTFYKVVPNPTNK